MSLTHSEERRKNQRCITITVGTNTVKTDMQKHTLCLQIFRSEELGIDWRIILKFILYKSVGRAWTGFIWLRIRDRWEAFVSEVMNLLVP